MSRTSQKMITEQIENKYLNPSFRLCLGWVWGNLFVVCMLVIRFLHHTWFGWASGWSQVASCAILDCAKELFSTIWAALAPAHATWGKKEPIHEETFRWSGISRIQHKQSMPLVLLLATAIGLRIALGCILACCRPVVVWWYQSGF